MIEQKIRDECYYRGVTAAIDFFTKNDIVLPQFFTYEQAMLEQHNKSKLLDRLRRVMPLQGAATGYYAENCIFVNLPVTALPAAHPTNRRQSYPGWKTDRTATGVVAHEAGHHAINVLERTKRVTVETGKEWRDLLTRCHKQVSGYEPIPSEAMAETLRLFILNPQLLRAGIPDRYAFVREEMRLQPVQRRHWRDVLRHPEYEKRAEVWILK